MKRVVTKIYCNRCGCKRSHESLEESSRSVLLNFILTIFPSLSRDQWYACEYCGEVHKKGNK